MRKTLVPFFAISLCAGVAYFTATARLDAAPKVKVKMCHKGRVIQVAPEAKAAHLAHGDCAGAQGAVGDACTTCEPEPVVE